MLTSVQLAEVQEVVEALARLGVLQEHGSHNQASHGNRKGSGGKGGANVATKTGLGSRKFSGGASYQRAGSKASRAHANATGAPAHPGTASSARLRTDRKARGAKEDPMSVAQLSRIAKSTGPEFSAKQRALAGTMLAARKKALLSGGGKSKGRRKGDAEDRAARAERREIEKAAGKDRDALARMLAAHRSGATPADAIYQERKRRKKV